MKESSSQNRLLNERLGCFGEFNREDAICRRFCSLSLRCCIEREQNEQMELLEDMITSETLYFNVQ
ncbi:MAG: hypothetical protein ACLFRG_01300 [Desulfococcaceae bacterium]